MDSDTAASRSTAIQGSWRFLKRLASLPRSSHPLKLARNQLAGARTKAPDSTGKQDRTGGQRSHQKVGPAALQEPAFGQCPAEKVGVRC